LWQGLAIIPVLLIGCFDIYFRGLSLIEIGEWVGIGFFATLIGIGIVIALFVVFVLSKGKRPQIIRKPRDDFDYSLGEMVMIALREEIIYRGPLIAVFLIWKLPTVAWTILIIIDGLLFGLAHFVNRGINICDFVILSWMGIILSGLVLKSGSLTLSILLHLSLLIFLQALNRFAPIVVTAKTKNTLSPEN
jgi:membrane protease YdiL (CAAX protease family)